MIRDRHLGVAKGLVSLATLLALLLGPPALLATQVGWPLPTTIPTWDEVQQTLTIGVQDQVIVKALALLGWIIWLQVATSIMLEVAATLRGRAADARLVLPGIRVAVGQLVASATLAITTFGSGFPSGASSPAIAPTVQLVGVPDVLATAVPSVAEIPDLRPAFPAVPTNSPSELVSTTIQVQRHDSYWAIAERALGDGLRWRDIRDLNVGRTMADGHTVTAGSDQPRAGWTLMLPAGSPEQIGDVQAETASAAVTTETAPAPPAAAGTDSSTKVTAVAAAPAPSAGAPSGGSTEMIVERGDNMWSLAEKHLAAARQRPVSSAEVAPYWLRFVETNRHRFAHADNPSLIYPDQTFLLPPVEIAAPVPAPVEPSADPAASEVSEAPPVEDEAKPEAVPSAPRSTTTSAPASIVSDTSTGQGHPGADDSQGQNGADSRRAAREQDSPTSGMTVVALLGAASTALAVGVTEAIRRRRQRRNHHAPGTVAAPPEQDRDLHRQLVRDADHDAFGQLRHALDELARAVAAKKLSCRPLVVQHGPDQLDVLLDHATSPAVDGWRVEASGLIWARNDDRQPTESHGTPDASPATPLLVTLGRPQDGSQLYLDLEAARVVTLIGDDGTARGLARAMVTELANSPLADAVQVIVVGQLGAAAGDLDRVTVVDSWDDVRSDLAAWADQSRQALAANGWPNPFMARGSGARHEALTPLVVVATAAPDDATQLDSVLTGAPAAAVVTIGAPIEGATLIECSPDQLRLPRLGLACQPQPVAPEVIEALVGLLGHAENADSEPLELFPEEPDPEWVDEPPGDNQSYEDPPHDILVRLLGEITVEGAKKPLTAKQTAVVTFVALHGTVSADSLEDAVWATAATGSHRKRLANTISDCRRLLGPDHLPVAVDGHYTAGPGLLTDTELFEQRLRAAASQPTEAAADTLQGALNLVKDKVFTYRAADRASFAWVDVENWVSLWEAKITALTQHLAELYLDLGRPDQAIKVARHALGIVPTHTAITETLMRAHAANGDRLAIKRVYEAHVGALDQLDLDEPAESTTALYVELRQRMAT